MTTHQNQPNFTDDDAALLSAYIDDALPPDETTQLEARLDDDPTLRAELQALRYTVALLNDLPELQAPRDFTLSAEQAAARRPAPTDNADTTPDNITQLPTRNNGINWTLWGSLAATFAVIFIGVSIALTTLDTPLGTQSAQEVAQQPTTTPTIAMSAPASADDDAAVESADALDDDMNNNMGGASAEGAMQNQGQRSAPAVDAVTPIASPDANTFAVQPTQSVATSVAQESSAEMTVPQSANSVDAVDMADADVAEETIEEEAAAESAELSAPQGVGTTGDVAADENAEALESDAADSAEFYAPDAPQSAEPAPPLTLPEIVGDVSLPPIVQRVLSIAEVLVQILVALLMSNGV